MQTHWLLYVFVSSLDPNVQPLTPALEARPMPTQRLCEQAGRELLAQLNAHSPAGGRNLRQLHQRWHVRTACVPAARG